MWLCQTTVHTSHSTSWPWPAWCVCVFYTKVASNVTIVTHVQFYHWMSKGNLGHPFLVWIRDMPLLYLSIHSVVPKGWIGHQGTFHCVPRHNPLFQLSYPSVPNGQWETFHEITTGLCPTCSSFLQSPRDIMGHQGTSHGVPQQKPLSHLSIPSLLNLIFCWC